MQTAAPPPTAQAPTAYAIMRALKRIDRAQGATIQEVRKAREEVAQKA